MSQLLSPSPAVLSLDSAPRRITMPPKPHPQIVSLQEACRILVEQLPIGATIAGIDKTLFACPESLSIGNKSAKIESMRGMTDEIARMLRDATQNQCDLDRA